MRPPECGKCGEMFRPAEGSLIVFCQTESDKDWYRRSETEGFVGHPPNQEWFCPLHQSRAEELSGLSRAEAMAAWNAAAGD